MLTTDPMIRRHLASIVTYPQYWGYLLTGERASDFTSLGCHSDLWNPYARDFATTLDALGLRSCFAPVRRPDEILGEVKPALAQKLGLPAHLPVMVGIHDSNASLYPHLLSQSGSFSVVSSGTWTIAMAIHGSKLALDPNRDSLINVNALGDPVPTARFMGGREFDLIQNGRIYAPTKSDEQSVLEKGIFLLPAREAATGPFQGRVTAWSVAKRSAGEESVALSFYLALMTRTCLDLIGARGPVIVEGPFANNNEYLRMLSVLSPEGLLTSVSHTGTSIGAALLCLTQHKQAATALNYACQDEPALQAYGAAWRGAVESGL
jgi:sugar (pentulose or hexulose) kinase